MALITRYLLTVCLLFWAGVACADQAVDLYSADVLVKSQSQAQRAAGAKKALAEVLVRVSGSVDAPSDSGVASALNNAQKYVYEYSYQSSDQTLEGIDGEPVPAEKLVLKFSPSLVNKLLHDAGLPFWPANRPAVLVWLVTNDASGPHMVDTDALWQSLHERAKARGLPVSTPLFDLDDHIALSAKDLWEKNSARIVAASKRYHTDSILVLSYSAQSDSQWRGSWELLHAEDNRDYSGTADSPEALMAQAVDSVANHFAKLYAISPRIATSANVVMRLDNINSFADYKTVEDYLTQLVLVRRLEVESIKGSSLTLRLYTEGDTARLENRLALDDRLKKASDGVSLPSNRYQVRGSEFSPLLYRLAQ